MKRLLDQSSWNIQGQMLLFKTLCSGDFIEHVRLTMTPIWIQVHGLPVEKTTREAAHEVALKAGNVLEVDFQSQRTIWVAQYIRVVLF